MFLLEMLDFPQKVYSPFVSYYQCEEQNKLVLVIDNNYV